MKQLYQTLVVTLSLCAPWYSNAQNLISNPGFEIVTTCPEWINNDLSYAPGWNDQYLGVLSADQLIHACGMPGLWIPWNYFGEQMPHTGNGYAMIETPQCDVCTRAYAVNHLTAPLVAGVTYYFEIYVTLADGSHVAHNRFGAYFSSASTEGWSAFCLPYTPQVSVNSFITDKTNWVLVSGTFTASGGEEYMTFGSFAPYDPADFIPVPGGYPTMTWGSYYYMDDAYLGINCNMPDNILGPDMQMCADSTTITTLNAYHPNAQSYLWSNGSTQSSININQSGTYWVQYTSALCARIDTIQIIYKPVPRVNLGNDTTLCAGQSLKLGKDIGPILYAWNGGVPGVFRTVTTSGTYSLYVAKNGCSSTDTIKVKFETKPPVSLGNDIILCPNTAHILESSHPDSTYLWNTGSNSNSIIAYDAGVYWLEVNNKGCRNRDTITLTNTSLKPFSIGPDTAICNTTPLLLRADSSNATTYIWNTGSFLPSITVNTAGTYWVEALQENCALRDSIVISTKPLPSPNLGPDRSLCLQSSTTLNAGNPGASYLWDNNTTGQFRIVSQAQSYWVKVNLNGCSLIDTLELFPEQPPALELGTDTLLCSDLSITLDAGYPGASVKWQDGSTQPVITVTTQGKYKAVLTKGSCILADSVSIFFYQKPLLNLGKDSGSCFTVPYVLQSSLVADKYLWQDGSAGNLYQTSTPGLYWLEITKSVCKVRDTILLTQYPLPAVNLGNDKSLCKEDVMLLDAGNAGASFLWNDLITSQTRTVSAPGVFRVAVTNSFACTAIDSIVLDTFISPVVNLGKDTFVCEGQTFILDAGSFNSYQWQDGSNHSYYEVAIKGTYSVTVKDGNNCTAADSISLLLKAAPQGNWVALKKICEPDLLLSPGNQFKTYLWYDGSTEPTVRATDYGLYTVSITDDNNCTNTVSTELINACPGTLFVPNAFTPNGDNLNDLFLPVYKNIKSIHFAIYDRWGLLLFETTDMKKGWNGRNTNSTYTSDVYVYKIIYVGMDDHTRMESGDVTLIR